MTLEVECDGRPINIAQCESSGSLSARRYTWHTSRKQGERCGWQVGEPCGWHVGERRTGHWCSQLVLHREGEESEHEGEELLTVCVCVCVGEGGVPPY